MGKKELINKLKPFWKKHKKLRTEFLKKEEKLESEMNKKLKLKVELGFFYVDGGPVGIRAMDFHDRKKFPLIHKGELYN